MKKYVFILFIALSYLGQINSAAADLVNTDRILYLSSIEIDAGATNDFQNYRGTWTAYVTTSADNPIPAKGNYICLTYRFHLIDGTPVVSAASSQCRELSTQKTWGEAAAMWIKYVAEAEGNTTGTYSNVQHNGPQKEEDCLVFAFVDGPGSRSKTFTEMSGCIDTPPITEVPCTLSIGDIDFGEIMTTDLPGTLSKDVALSVTCESPITDTDATLELESLNMINDINYLDDANQLKYDFKFGTQDLDELIDVPFDTSSGGYGPFPVNGVTIEISTESTDISPGVYTATDTIIYYVK